jgi:hypothetical protein
MELQDLVGERVLTGVDFGTLPADREGGRWEDASSITFVLDGHAYCAIEDPSDGYRSCMQSLDEVPVESVKNVFAPCRVLGRYRTKGTYGSTDDVLELIDLVTAKVVLEVGTDNSDDYYPSFVSNFSPEHMAINQPQKADA